jgi:hypothetical protein
MKVILDDDCGNSPKNLFLKKFTVALLNCEMKYIVKNTTDGIIWEKVGANTLNRKDNFIRELSNHKNKKPTLLQIDSIISHGKSGSVNGIMKFKEKHRLAFCNVYKFQGYADNIKVKKIISYIINLKSNA